MKYTSKPLLPWTLVLIPLVLVDVATAQPAYAATDGGSGQEAEHCRYKGHRGKFAEKKLDALHAALKLAPEQESAWKDWSGKMTGAHSDWKERHEEFATWQRLPVPERMEKWLAFAKERVSKLEQRVADTKVFYATLSSEQQKTFDTEYAFRPHGHGRLDRK